MGKKKNRKKKKVKVMTNTLAAQKIIGTDIKFIIDEEVYAKVMHWVDKSNHEVSGFGSVEWDKEKKIFRVTDAILLDQDNSPTSSEISPLAIGKAMYELREQPNAMKWWWHSHVNMSVFWSGDDMNCIRGLGQQGWITATVFNKKRECRSAYYQLTDVMDNKHEVFVDEIPTTIDYKLDTTKIAEWDAAYDKHVTEKKYVATPNFQLGQYARPTYEKGKTVFDDRQMYMDDYWGDGYGNNYYSKRDLTPEKVEMQRQNTFGLTDDWDNEGWRLNPKTQDYQYNPLRDNKLKGEEAYKAIASMDRSEFEELYFSDPVFKAFVYQSIAGVETK